MINTKISERVENFLTLLFIGIIFFSTFSSILSSEFSMEKVWASPNPLVIDFENLSHRDFIYNQYANMGVIFHGSSVKDFSQSPGFAHSGVKAIQPCPLATEFCSSPIIVSFTAPQTHVKVWIGQEHSFNEQKLVVLRAFDSSGTQVGESSHSLPATPNPIPVSIPLEVNTQNAMISSIIVTIADADTCVCTGFLTIDDIEFDSAGAEPPCQTTQDPFLVVNRPVSGFSSQFNSFHLDGNVFSEVIIDSANVTATSTTTGETRTYNLSWQQGGSFNTNVGELLFPGNNIITLKVQNCHGTTEIDRTVIFNPIMPGTRLNFMGIEVTQAIQDMDNTVPLITDKRTFARVYFAVNGPNNQLADVTGVLSAYTAPGIHKGGEFIGSVTSLNSITVTNDNNITSKRDRYPDGSLNFEIPLNWINSPGQIHFSVTPYIEGRIQGSTASLVPCEDTRLATAWRLSGCDNLEEFSASNAINNLDSFGSVPSPLIEIRGIPFTVGPNTFVPTQLDYDLLWSWLHRVYPTGQIRGTISTDTGISYDHRPSCQEVNSDLFNRWLIDVQFGGVDRDTRYIGLVSDTNGFMRGCAPGSPSAVASGPTGTRTWGWDTDGTYADWYGGHEIGHTYGREHPGFADKSDGTCTNDNSLQDTQDEDYPYGGGKISTGFQHFGFDVGDPGNSIPPDVKSPFTWTDVMTYRCFQWMSDYTYGGIMNDFRSQDLMMTLFDTSSNQLSQVPQTAKQTNLTLSVIGNINLNKSSVDLNPFMLLPGVNLLSRSAVNSSFSIDLIDTNGQVLEQYPFQPKNYTDRVSGEDQIALIGELVPYVSGVKQIAISKNGEMLAFRNVSDNKPDIKILSPTGSETLESSGTATIRWNSSDKDGDKLTYSLLYSINGGKNWKTINSGINETNYKVNLEDLPGSDHALFRVIATDGVNTAIDDSNATFRISSKAPDVRIISPGDNSTISTRESITLTGEALDLEDEILDGKVLIWTSNKQGKLGFGHSISVDGLSPGLHEITLSARDKNGNINHDSIHLLIYPIPPIAIAEEADQQDNMQNTVGLNATSSLGSSHISYQWEIVSKPNQSNATIINPNLAKPRLVTDLAGTYVIDLIVKDITGLTGTDRVIINNNQDTNKK